MRILCIDTSMACCQVGLYLDGEEEAYQHYDSNRGSAEKIIPMIETLLETVNQTYEDIDLFAVMRGPGSFTGIRVGLSTARALALASGKPVVGIGSLQAMLLSAPKKENVVALIDTKRGDDYMLRQENGIGQDITISNRDIQFAKDVTVLKDQQIDLSLVSKWLEENYSTQKDRLITDPIYVRPAEAKRAKSLPTISWDD